MKKNNCPFSYLFLLFTIGFISVLDAWFNIAYCVHCGVEENPVAKQILILSNNNVALLIAFKVVGTLLALAFLKRYYYYNASRPYLVAWMLVFIQIGLACYMMAGLIADLINE